MAQVGADIVAALAGDGDGGAATTSSLTLRRYAPTGALGRHTDGNLVTLLWSSKPGLQALAAEGGGGGAEDAALMRGLPRTGVVVDDGKVKRFRVAPGAQILSVAFFLTD